MPREKELFPPVGEPFPPPEEKKEQPWEQLGITEEDWEDLGKTGQNFIIWLTRLLQSQIDEGFLEEEDTKDILQDRMNRLWGVKPYTKRYLVTELPEFRQVRSLIREQGRTEEAFALAAEGLPLATAQRLAGLSLEERRIALQEIEQAEAQKQAVAITKQQGLLPLGRGGTGAEQVWQADWAIRSLQTQLSVAPDYLKPTIQGQIQALSEFQTEQKGIETAKARMGGAVSARGEVTSGAYAGMDLISALKASEGAEGEQLLVKYWGTRSRPGETFYQWLDSPEGVAIQQASGMTVVRPVGGTPESEERKRVRALERTEVTPPSFEQLGTQGSLSWREEFERRYPTILREFAGKPLEERQPENWAELLRKRQAEFREKWENLPYYQRGERPSTFAPPIRTISAF